MKTKLSGEIGDRVFDRTACPGFSIGVLARKIIAERVVDFLQFAQESFVLLRTGLWFVRFQSSGSSCRNRRRAEGSQVHQRLKLISRSGSSASGKIGVTL